MKREALPLSGASSRRSKRCAPEEPQGWRFYSQEREARPARGAAPKASERAPLPGAHEPGALKASAALSLSPSLHHGDGAGPAAARCFLTVERPRQGNRVARRPRSAPQAMASRESFPLGRCAGGLRLEPCFGPGTTPAAGRALPSKGVMPWGRALPRSSRSPKSLLFPLAHPLGPGSPPPGSR